MKLQSLQQILQLQTQPLYIALSGGIDSLTLMTVAAKARTAPTIAVHAVSAAVPLAATERCRGLAKKFGWQLEEIDAGEFNHEQYVANPVNRCYYCKSSLFDAILARIEDKAAGQVLIATGTNTDDLGDYRPGLKAAAERQVWQPYVEAGIDKNAIRAIAVEAGLGDLSRLPAQPCLSSRIETGITINVDDLRFVHKVESALEKLLGPGDIRCRVVSEGVVAQVPDDSGVFTDDKKYQLVENLVKEICADNNRQLVRVAPYSMGSAFLHHTQPV